MLNYIRFSYIQFIVGIVKHSVMRFYCQLGGGGGLKGASCLPPKPLVGIAKNTRPLSEWLVDVIILGTIMEYIRRV